jgi:hypothetical protein
MMSLGDTGCLEAFSVCVYAGACVCVRPSSGHLSLDIIPF